MAYGVRFVAGLLAVFTLLGGVFVWLNFQDEGRGPPPQMHEPVSEHELVEVPILENTKDSLSDQILRFSIDIHEPKVLLARSPLYAKEANDVIHRFVDTIKGEFKNNVSEAAERSRNINEPDSGDYASDLTIRFTPLLLSPTMISIRFDVSEYYAGAAHPNNYARVLNYHFEKHQLLSSTDLFASSTQALPFLSDYTRSALQKTFSDVRPEEFAALVFPGTAPKSENFREVGITKNGLTVIFNPYQVAPYARGTVEVKIPLPDLENTISDETREAIRMANENIAEAEPE